MTGYKGFDSSLRCRGKQYSIGKTEQEDHASLCNQGLHFCEYPLDCFAYYPPSDSRYCKVEADDVSDQTDDDSKRVAKRLTIGAEIGIPGIVKASVKYILDRVAIRKSEAGDRSAATNTGDQSAATNTGYQSAATNTGDQSAATNKGNRSAATSTGDWSAATNTGYQSAATNTGYQSAATNTGYQSAATNTGDRSAATNTGDRSAATNTGNRSAATNTGDQSAATNTGNRSAATNTGNRSVALSTGFQSAAIVTGKNSVAIATGVEGRAKADIGEAIVLCEYDDNGNLSHISSSIVDGVNIKANTFYTLKGGRLLEIPNEN